MGLNNGFSTDDDDDFVPPTLLGRNKEQCEYNDFFSGTPPPTTGNINVDRKKCQHYECVPKTPPATTEEENFSIPCVSVKNETKRRTMENQKLGGEVEDQTNELLLEFLSNHQPLPTLPFVIQSLSSDVNDEKTSPECEAKHKSDGRLESNQSNCEHGQKSGKILRYSDVIWNYRLLQ